MKFLVLLQPSDWPFKVEVFHQDLAMPDSSQFAREADHQSLVCCDMRQGELAFDNALSLDRGVNAQRSKVFAWHLALPFVLVAVDDDCGFHLAPPSAWPMA